MTRVLVPSDYTRTRVIGYSIIHDAWSYFYAAIPNPAAWELLWYSGGAIDNWADPDYVGWTYNGPDFANTGGLINPVSGGTDPSAGAAAVDRVLLCISGMSIMPINNYPPGGYTNSVAQWVGHINTSISNIRSKYPNVRMILLQGPLGGPGWAACNGFEDATFNPNPPYENRQTYHSLVARSAITSVTRANVHQGAQLTISSCARFTDWSGHPDAQGSQEIGEAMALYYASNL